MFKKAIPDLMSSVYISNFQDDLEYTKCFCFYLIFSVRSGDHKTFYWTKGIINTLIKHIDLCIKTDKEELLELLTITLFELTKDCCKL